MEAIEARLSDVEGHVRELLGLRHDQDPDRGCHDETDRQGSVVEGRGREDPRGVDESAGDDDGGDDRRAKQAIDEIKCELSAEILKHRHEVGEPVRPVGRGGKGSGGMRHGLACDGHGGGDRAENTKLGGGQGKWRPRRPRILTADEYDPNDKLEEWRAWKEDAFDYFDTVNPGVKEKIWRALKQLTGGKARKVVTAVKEENGYEAWCKLSKNFEPGLASMQGRVIAEFGDMIKNPAKTPNETRRLINELIQKKKRVEDITGQEMEDIYSKAVLAGILDPMTRQHTAMYHGTDTTSEAFKKTILEFTNDAGQSSRGQAPMQIGRKQEDELNDLQDDWHDEGDGDDGGHLWALKGSQCFACGEWGFRSGMSTERQKQRKGRQRQRQSRWKERRGVVEAMVERIG